jgi:Zn-dependent protease with chaperone function
MPSFLSVCRLIFGTEIRVISAKWVLIAFVIATPIAYYAINKWLGGFTYKTTLSWWVFVLAGILAFVFWIIYRVIIDFLIHFCIFIQQHK